MIDCVDPTKRSRRNDAITEQGEARLKRIKGSMLPYLDSIAEAIARLKTELYG
ncbi:MAG TPA: hypothetical protein VIX60_09120 [Candidatus Cybelea sp.]